MLSLTVILCVLAGVSADQWQDSTGYPSASGWQSYQSYGPPQTAPTFTTGGSNCAPGFSGGSGFNDVVAGLSNYKSGLLSTGASAAIAALIAKLPALIFLKVFIFKLIVVPMLFIFVAIPVLMPLLMMLMPMMMNMMNMMNGGDMMSTTMPTTTTAAAATGRSARANTVTELDEVLRSLLGSQRCLERVACRLGTRDTESTYRKPITWLLKQLQAMVPAGYREKVRAYRQAYMTGAQGECDPLTYPCETPRLLVQQQSRTFRVY